MKTTIHKGRIAGSITAPASKSYAQRAVAAALLAGGETTLTHLDLCNDTRAALDVARRLGASVSHEGTTYTIRGGLNPVSTKLNIGESGLATRLFTRSLHSATCLSRSTAKARSCAARSK
ncbi:MAG: hypothetical protein ACLR1G_09965 [Alistipes indistinctus]